MSSNPVSYNKERAEKLYNRLTGYRFAQRYIQGGTVLDIRCARLDPDVSILAAAAERVVCLTDAGSTRDCSPPRNQAENISYQHSALPRLPDPDEPFDAVVALEVIEKLDQPERLVTEVKRVLKRGGIFVVSTPDKQTHTNDRNYKDPAHTSEMHTLQFRELLEANFEHMRIYRQGIVCGGIFLGSDNLVSSMPTETFKISEPENRSGSYPLTTHFNIAVCGDSELPDMGDESLLLLDDERTIFEECEEYLVSLDLLREEIKRIENTEVQAFRERVQSMHRQNTYLKSTNEDLGKEKEALLSEKKALLSEKKTLLSKNEWLTDRLDAMENALTWRIFGPLRRLRANRGSSEKTD